jgi:(p)ppGpp synthase/HD superfamily hydrolase
MSIVTTAIEFATEHHKSMVRKGTRILYLTHLFNVCKILVERNCGDEILACALLRDIVEDTDLTIREVEKKFARAASMVAEVTEPFKLDKANFNKTDAILPEFISFYLNSEVGKHELDKNDNWVYCQTY